MPTLGIVHTSFALIEPLKKLTDETFGSSVRIVNVVDDTLLQYAREHGVDERLTKRMVTYFESAALAGAHVILNACSTVGETVDVARHMVAVPIVKIDEPMAEEAVRQGERIAVLATVASTLGPTMRLFQQKAAEIGKNVQLSETLCDGALDLLMAGEPEKHDELLAEAVYEAAKTHDVIAFAQASMARLVPALEGDIKVPLLASPVLAMQRVKDMLGV